MPIETNAGRPEEEPINQTPSSVPQPMAAVIEDKDDEFGDEFGEVEPSPTEVLFNAVTALNVPDVMSDEEAATHATAEEQRLTAKFNAYEAYLNGDTDIDPRAQTDERVPAALGGTHSAKAAEWMNFTANPAFRNPSVRAFMRSLFDKCAKGVQLENIMGTPMPSDDLLEWVQVNAQSEAPENVDLGHLLPGYTAVTTVFRAPGAGYMTVVDNKGHTALYAWNDAPAPRLAAPGM